MNTKILSEFESTINRLFQLLSSFTQEEINKVPFEGSWTAAQLAEHLNLSYGISEIFWQSVKPAEREVDQKVEQLKTIFLNFENKFSAPDFILPPDKIYNKEVLLNSLTNKITKIKEAITTLDLSLVCLDFELPVLGKLTRLEWIYFIIYHTQRHLHQLKNIHNKVVNNKKVDCPTDSK